MVSERIPKLRKKTLQKKTLNSLSFLGFRRPNCTLMSEDKEAHHGGSKISLVKNIEIGLLFKHIRNDFIKPSNAKTR